MKYGKSSWVYAVFYRIGDGDRASGVRDRSASDRRRPVSDVRISSIL